MELKRRVVKASGSNCGSQRDNKDQSESRIHIAWNSDVHIAHPRRLLSETPCCISGVMLNYPPRQIRLSLSPSNPDSFSFPIHLSREHQQCFRPGLHQRVPDSEWPAGPRKPTLLSRIHSHCQGELRGGIVTVWTRDRKAVSSVDHEGALIWVL